ncbi:hypothetical protein LX36DRAFT_109393 [Colletotrichum falcatum]|nr:hypothetical protein LX36DRAFT_109393 [Colletotrichum falcatum]
MHTRRAHPHLVRQVTLLVFVSRVMLPHSRWLVGYLLLQLFHGGHMREEEPALPALFFPRYRRTSRVSDSRTKKKKTPRGLNLERLGPGPAINPPPPHRLVWLSLPMEMRTLSGVLAPEVHRGQTFRFWS